MWQSDDVGVQARYVEYVDRESELHANTLEEKMMKQAKIGNKQQLSALE